MRQLKRCDRMRRSDAVTSWLVRTRREITLVQATSWMLALAGSAGALAWAFLLFFADIDKRAVVVAAAGLMLALWAAIHLTDRQHRR